MNEPDAIHAPSIDPPTSMFDEKWRREYVAFIRLLPELLQTERDRFVAVHDGSVVAVADTFENAALKAYDRVGYVSMHVGQVTEGPVVPVRLPSPRVESRAGLK